MCIRDLNRFKVVQTFSSTFSSVFKAICVGKCVDNKLHRLVSDALDSCQYCSLLEPSAELSIDFRRSGLPAQHHLLLKLFEPENG